MPFDFCKLFEDVFQPQSGETVTFMVDNPHDNISGHAVWDDRNKLAFEWQGALNKASNRWGIKVNSLIEYSATGGHNIDLPEMGIMNGDLVKLADVIMCSTIIISMPQFSATAPLIKYTERNKKLRIASMPLVERRMQETGLAADYKEISRRCTVMQPLFNDAIGGEVEFSTGHHCYFDLRFREAHKDDGILSFESVMGGGRPLSNLPAGETYQAPYEGEKQGISSETLGELPIKRGNELIVLTVEQNKIVKVSGDGKFADEMRSCFEVDDARRNIAEFAIGCNDKAAVTGNILEDEKAGFHWAYGRSEHIGGTVDVKSFKDPANVVHNDVIYACKSPIIAKTVKLIFEDGRTTTIVKDCSLAV